jgi:ADP-ribose pyrophosphatase
VSEPGAPPTTFEATGERLLYQTDWLTLSAASFRGPDGGTFERDVVHHPGWVGVIPLTNDEHVVCVRQFRAAIGEWLLEIPAGIRDVAGEGDEGTARRELAEEAGLACEHLEVLAKVHNSPGFTDEDGVVFLATGLSDVTIDRQSPEEQHMTIERIPVADLLDLIAAGAVTDAKTVIAFALVAGRRQ